MQLNPATSPFTDSSTVKFWVGFEVRMEPTPANVDDRRPRPSTVADWRPPTAPGARPLRSSLGGKLVEGMRESMQSPKMEEFTWVLESSVSRFLLGGSWRGLVMLSVLMFGACHPVPDRVSTGGDLEQELAHEEESAPWKARASGRSDRAAPASIGESGTASDAVDTRPETLRRLMREGDFKQAFDLICASSKKSSPTDAQAAIQSLQLILLQGNPTPDDMRRWLKAFEPDGQLAGYALETSLTDPIDKWFEEQSTGVLLDLLEGLQSGPGISLVHSALGYHLARDSSVLEISRNLSPAVRDSIIDKAATESGFMRSEEFLKKLDAWGGSPEQKELRWYAYLNDVSGVDSAALFAEAELATIPKVKAGLERKAYQVWLREDSLAASKAIRENAHRLPDREYDEIVQTLVNLAKDSGDHETARAWAETSRQPWLRQRYKDMFLIPKDAQPPGP